MKSPWIVVTLLGIVAAGHGATAQSNLPASPGSGPAEHAMPMPQGMPGAMPGHHQMDGQMGTMTMNHPTPATTTPTAPGQAAFGAVQEIVEMLQADPGTDWSKVDIDALRRHLIDMDEVTLRAIVRKQPVDNGLRITVTGSGRTQEAIQRMVPDHAREISGMNGWVVGTRMLSNGVELTVTSINLAEAQKIRGLGFMGIMAQGGHHQVHHLAMAKGEAVHRH